jgi:hypothetical protein
VGDGQQLYVRVRAFKLANIQLSSLLHQSLIADHGTTVVSCLDFVPSCGNKFFMAATDAGLKLFDFETEQVCRTDS